ncbi:preprotein translocase subunit SecG [Gleimia sp. 6138-11-ORH1]|uniref:preprotein translocase subunit SecG n=1 Tax=Gleimia sp. 6138-11-ORH1 TaxID=2973937 RepID=UPI002166EA20|nr:preprotein translocase subunit SecG [Gleimia sp. 6138-11-ORH1]MCS4484326.1 preprotein translocase subunit SecG [Gleimia sp. 6138-11-ORH1]
MNAFLYFLYVLLVISSLFLILTVLMHKGKGGGVSDMFGGGLSQTAGSSGVAERNLNRITLATLTVWITVIVAIGILSKFAL